MEEQDEHGESTNQPLLYLARETRGTRHLEELAPDERRKVQCGARHFERVLGVSYRVVVEAGELP